LLFKFGRHSLCAFYVFVVVQSATQVKITDFGLAKVLELNQYQVYAGGGKVQFSLVAKLISELQMILLNFSYRLINRM